MHDSSPPLSPPSPPSPLPPPAASPWEKLDRALSRLESAILTQKNNKTENNTLETERLQRQNSHLTETLRQTLAEITTLLKT